MKRHSRPWFINPGRLRSTYTNFWVARDGSRRLIEWSNTLLFDEQIEVEFMVCVGTDVTEKTLADATLKESSQRLNEAQRIAQVGSWELDLTNGKLTWSDEIFRLFEIDPTTFGASYEAFLNAIHPEDRDRVNQAYTNSLAARAPYEIVHRLCMPDGRIKWVNERCETFYDANREKPSAPAGRCKTSPNSSWRKKRYGSTPTCSNIVAKPFSSLTVTSTSLP
jgi:PAS domain-containing protein